MELESRLDKSSKLTLNTLPHIPMILTCVKNCQILIWIFCQAWNQAHSTKNRPRRAIWGLQITTAYKTNNTNNYIFLYQLVLWKSKYVSRINSLRICSIKHIHLPLGSTSGSYRFRLGFSFMASRTSTAKVTSSQAGATLRLTEQVIPTYFTKQNSSIFQV